MKGHGYSSRTTGENAFEMHARCRAKTLFAFCVEGAQTGVSLMTPSFWPIRAQVSVISQVQHHPLLAPCRGCPTIKSKACTPAPRVGRTVLSLYYTDSASPHALLDTQGEATKVHGIPFKTIPSQRKGQHKYCHTGHNIRIVQDGKFVTQSIQSDKILKCGHD